MNDLKRFLSKRPRTMAHLVSRYHCAPVVEQMRAISDAGDAPVLYAPAYQDGQIFVYWIEPEKRTARWRAWFAALNADLDRTEVL